jgi:ribosomal protein L11 methyltransferase
MNSYYQIKLITENNLIEIIIAELAELGFESFEEGMNEIFAYIPEELFHNIDNNAFNDILSKYQASLFSAEKIKTENWNALWESNYPPVKFNDFCFIHAPFHTKDDNVEFDIVIEPKMSFGTAHHETTALMIKWLQEENVEGKTVLDMGCGTAVLAILAKMKKAKYVLGIDNDSWAYENSIENCQNNHVEVEIILGDAKNLVNLKFDLIIANINRNILINDMKNYANSLNNGGTILFSGFYLSDLESVKQSAEKNNLKFHSYKQENNWVAAKFLK